MTDSGCPRLAPRPASGGPRVSVIMPTYRRAHQIGQSIRSLLEGTWTDFELLVRDDGDRRDGTAEAVEAAAGGDPRVRYHRNPTPLRMPGNLNSGIMDSCGDFIAVCHDHDLYKPAFLAKMLGALDRHRTALFVHCAIDVIAQDGRHIKSQVGDWPELSAGQAWLEFMLSSLHCPVCALTLVRREAHEACGLYDPAYGFISDVELWMRLARHGDVAYVREPLIGVRERETDHPAATNGLPLIRMAARIHRRYLTYAYRAPERLPRRLLVEWRVATQTARCRVARMVHGIRGSGKR